MIYEHWTEVPRTETCWPYKFFTPQELACKGSGSLLVIPSFVEALDQLRHLWGGPLTVNSCYRSPRHNAIVGGSPLSRHKAGDAVDISIVGRDRKKLRMLAINQGWDGIGLYNSFIHLDLRGSKARWGSW